MRAFMHNSVPVMAGLIIGFAPLFANYPMGLWLSIPIGGAIGYSACKFWFRKMSTATDALTVGLTELHRQLGKAFTYGGVSFKACAEPRERKDDFERSYGVSDQWDTELIVDPSVTAFNGGLPSSGEVVTQSSNNKQFTVVSVEHDDGDHVAIIKAQKLG